MRIAIVANRTREQAMDCAAELLQVLTDLGCTAAILPELIPLTPEAERDPALSAWDLFIAVGGDGTIIHTAKLAAALNRPVLGVNAGTLGFTAGMERDELPLLSALMDGSFREEPRLMLSVALYADGQPREFTALNDAVVSGETAAIIDYQMALGENAGYHYRADGFIVATPTGSTAYSLSAGGPVIQPDMDCLVYTPVCSHALFSRSVVFGGDTRLTVNIPAQTGKTYLSVDGEAPIPLSTGDKLVFYRARRFARFIRLGNKDFYDVLNQKIR